MGVKPVMQSLNRSTAKLDATLRRRKERLNGIEHGKPPVERRTMIALDSVVEVTINKT